MPTIDDSGADAAANAANVANSLQTLTRPDITTQNAASLGVTYYDYDSAGHLWRTNARTGIDTVFLYDLQGFQTAEITSAGSLGVSSSRGVDLGPDATDPYADAQG